MVEVLLQQVSKTFGAGTPGEVRALRNISMVVTPGEFLVLLGPSGSGKSTILRLISGLEAPTEGEILFNGKRVERIPARERKVGMLFQQPALLPQLTVRRNIELAARLRDISGSQAGSLTRLIGVEHLGERFPETLSGGEQQRVALVRALVGQPEVLLMDEPLSNLDPENRMQLREVIQDLHQKMPVTTIFVTHDQGEASRFGGRIGILNRGSLEQVGTARELYERPANLFVAAFFGNGINLLRRYSSDSVLGFRPGDAELTTEGEFHAQVRQVTDLGTHFEVSAFMAEEEIRFTLPTQPELGPGQTARLHLRRVYLFDPATGKLKETTIH